MKNAYKLLLIIVITCCLQIQSAAQSFNEHISREFSLSNDAASCTLFIYNIDGFLKVEGYAGNKVILELDETISADDNKTLETGKKEFKLGFEQKSDSIIAYIAEPFDSRPRRRFYYSDDDREIKYSFHVDFTVKVPYAMNLHISTVNNGAVSVSNVSGILWVNNVNEGITLTNVKGATHAHTVNGDIIVNYLSNPQELSSYYTINGDIRVSYQPGLSADMQFKSMHGEFYTDFPDTKLLPAAAVKTQDRKGEGMVYRINKTTTVRFGKGGTTYKFETLNGDVYIRKQS